MGKVVDLTGMKFHRFTVINYAGINNSRKALWLCECDCGKKVVVVGQNMRNGSSKSCGCYGQEVLQKRNTDHGLSGTRLHRIWIGMKNRCLNEKTAGYRDYGAKGVTVCSDWENDYVLFHEWAITNGYNIELSLDRRDPEGNYEPQNCRWLSVSEQNRNKRNTIFIEIGGVSKKLVEWCEVYQVSPRLAWDRRRKGKTGLDLFSSVV